MYLYNILRLYNVLIPYATQQYHSVICITYKEEKSLRARAIYRDKNSSYEDQFLKAKLPTLYKSL